MKIILIFIVSIIFIACGGGEETTSSSSSNDNTLIKNESTNTIADNLKGEWIYISSGDKIYIDDNFKYEITVEDNNLISIEKNNKTYHLLRSGINDASVSGDIYTQDDKYRKVSSIGNIDIILQHITDKQNKKEQRLEKTGNFKFDNVKSGKYIITAKTDNNLSIETNIDIYGEEISLGSFKLVNKDGYNFKADFIIENSDSGYLYGNLKTYIGKLKIKNIGTKKGSGLNFSFKATNPYIAEFSNDIVLGTVDINKTKEIPFKISFNILDTTIQTIPMEVTINDANKNHWTDSVFFHVYQTPMKISIKTKESNIKGYIVSDGHQLTKINTSNEIITIPYRQGKKYYLVLSNPNINNETPYSIGVDTDTLSFESFQDTSAHEPNNNEEEAFTIKPNENIVSYLHEGDIDYYIIDMSSNTDVGLYSPPVVPFK